MKSLIYHKTRHSGCDYYRCEQPIEHCTFSPIWKASHNDKIIGPYAYGMEGNKTYAHAYVFQRFPFYECIDELTHLKKQGCRLAWELDDDLWNVPEWNPAYRLTTPEFLDTLNQCLDLVDLIFCSTEPLAKVINRPDKTRVLPNLINPAHFPSREEFNGPVRVVWAGSHYHWGDLQLLVKPIQKLIGHFGDRVQFVFVGDLPDGLARYERIAGSLMGRVVPAFPTVGLVDPEPPVQFFKKLCGLSPHIAVAPLVPCQFNESKSNIKLLEYSMAGAACVSSPVGPYRDLFGVHPTSAEEWEMVLAGLIQNQELCAELAEYGRKQTLAEYSWKNLDKLKVWEKAWTELVEG